MSSKEKFNFFAEKVSIFAHSGFSVLFNFVFALTAWFFKFYGIGILVFGVFSIIYSLTLKSMTPTLSLISLTVFMIFVDTNQKYVLQPTAFIGAGLITISFAIFMIKNKIKPALTANFWGMAAICLSLAFGGLIGYKGKVTGFLLIAAIAVVAALLYMVITSSIKSDAKRYMSKSFMSTGLIICAQMLIQILLSEDPNFVITHKALWLGWGITNAAALVFTITIPLTFYLAASSKSPYIYLTAAAVQCVFMFLTFSRGCIMILMIMIIPLIVFTIIRSLRRKITLITLSILFILSIVTIILLFKFVFTDFKIIWSLGLNDRGRIPLYKEALDIFRRNPIFGTGVMYKAGASPSYLYFFHNTFLQFMASFGVLGLAALCLHKIAQYFIYLRPSNLKKDSFFLFGLFALIMSDMYGLIDVSYFTHYYISIILCFMAVSDYEMRSSKTQIEENAASQKKMLYGINMKKTVILSLIIFIAVITVLFLIILLSGNMATLKIWHAFVFFILCAVLFILHELIHAAGYILFAGVSPKKIKFGANFKLMILYCYNGQPLYAPQIFLPLLMPLFFTGILPAVVSLITGNLLLASVSAILISGAAGDIVMAFNLIKNRKHKIIDHPSLPAYYILYDEDKLPADFVEATPEVEKAYADSCYPKKKIKS